MFSPYILWKNILEKEFARGTTHFLVLVKNILNVLWHTKNSSTQNFPSRKFWKEYKQLVIVNMIFLKVLQKLTVIKKIMIFKIIKHIIYNSNNLHCYPYRCKWPLQFICKFSVTEQNYQVWIFIFLNYKKRKSLVPKLLWFNETLVLFV